MMTSWHGNVFFWSPVTDGFPKQRASNPDLLVLYLMTAWINSWATSQVAGDLRGQWNIVPYNLCPQMASPDHIVSTHKTQPNPNPNASIWKFCWKLTWDIENLNLVVYGQIYIKHPLGWFYWQCYTLQSTTFFDIQNWCGQVDSSVVLDFRTCQKQQQEKERSCS